MCIHRSRRGIYHQHRRVIDAAAEGEYSTAAADTEQSPYNIKREETFVLRHPFNAILSGLSSCGKTYLVNDILQNFKNLCEPERIIWLYKRLQPMHDEIKTTIWPKVEFEQGISLDLEKESYLDPSVRHMIVLDDLMSTAAKDPQITDLFTV